MTTPTPASGTPAGIFDWANNATGFFTAALNGGLAAEPGMADELIALAQEMYDYLQGELPGLQMLGEPLPLSSTATAKWTSNLMQQVATDDNGGLTRLAQFNEGLPNWIAALTEAKKRYQETEAGNVDAVNHASPEA